MTLYRCDRLSATITDKQCNVNFNRGLFSCLGCPGLGDALELAPLVEPEKEDVMAMFRGYCTFCEKDDRPLVSKNGNTCWSCYKTKNDAKKNSAPEFVDHSGDDAPNVETLEDVVDEFVARMVAAQESINDIFTPLEEMPEMADLQEIAPRPHMSALCRLLDPDGWLVEIPRDLSLRLGKEGITPEDIVELLEALVCGELRRVA